MGVLNEEAKKVMMSTLKKEMKEFGLSEETYTRIVDQMEIDLFKYYSGVALQKMSGAALNVFHALLKK